MFARRTFTPTATPVHSTIALAPGAFVPEALVASWVRAGQARRDEARLTLDDGRRFVLVEALRVLGRRDGEIDPYGMTGRAEAVTELVRRGVVIARDGVRLGSAVYDVEPGFTVQPAPSADDSGAHPRAG